MCLGLIYMRYRPAGYELTLVVICELWKFSKKLMKDKQSPS
jgi:hypothetical protein